jgi:hypothetical protein
MTSPANYGGKVANYSAYIKQFNYGILSNLWKTISYIQSNGITITTITPSSNLYDNLYIPGNLYVDGTIINPSDINLKNNIEPIEVSSVDKLMNLIPSSYVYKNDPHNNIHYGFIAQDFEKDYPELVYNKVDSKYANIKGINYLEMIPLLVNKIQIMQREIDELKANVIVR